MKSGARTSTGRKRLGYQTLLAEAHANVVADRKNLNDVLEELRKAAEGDSDGSMAAELLQATVTVAEGLTRANAQLVELVKTEAKRDEDPRGDEPLSDEEAEGVWDALADENGKEPDSGGN